VVISNPAVVEAANALNSGAIHLLRQLRAVDRRSGLTPARLSALSVLVFAGPHTLGALARAEDVAGPTMTRIVDGLCDLGLAVREPHPDSARLVRVTATVDGEAVMRRAREARIDTIVAAIASLPAPHQKQLAAAASILDELAANVAKSLTDAP
jgi:DNA-binding MarR family transcriptional regulator